MVSQKPVQSYKLPVTKFPDKDLVDSNIHKTITRWTLCFINAQSHTTESWVLMTLNEGFENIVGKGKNAGNQHFLLLLVMFSALWKADPIVCASFILMSLTF